jgi:hypothetical protein
MDLVMPPIKVNMIMIEHLMCLSILNLSIYLFIYGI